MSRPRCLPLQLVSALSFWDSLRLPPTTLFLTATVVRASTGAWSETHHARRRRCDPYEPLLGHVHVAAVPPHRRDQYHRRWFDSGPSSVVPRIRDDNLCLFAFRNKLFVRVSIVFMPTRQRRPVFDDVVCAPLDTQLVEFPRRFIVRTDNVKIATVQFWQHKIDGFFSGPRERWFVRNKPRNHRCVHESGYKKVRR